MHWFKKSDNVFQLIAPVTYIRPVELTELEEIHD